MRAEDREEIDRMMLAATVEWIEHAQQWLAELPYDPMVYWAMGPTKRSVRTRLRRIVRNRYERGLI